MKVLEDGKVIGFLMTVLRLSLSVPS